MYFGVGKACIIGIKDLHMRYNTYNKNKTLKKFKKTIAFICNYGYNKFQILNLFKCYDKESTCNVDLSEQRRVRALYETCVEEHF